jgi:CelD/BcsL family acetyltransferase involved in cellulose biosynthesis
MTFEWQFLYWRHFGKKNSLRILTVFDGEKAVAIFPLAVHKRFGFRELRFISSSLSDYDDVLITRNEARQKEAIRAAMDLLFRTNKWDILRLKGIRKDSLAFESMHSVLDSDIPLCLFLQEHCDGAPQVDLTCGWDAYYSGLRKSFLSDIRTFQKRAGENREYISGDVAEEKDLLPLLEQFMQMHIKRRREAGDKSFFEDGKVRDFFCAVSREFFKRKWLDISQYKINDTIAAMEVGFIYNDRFYRYLAAFDSQFKKCAIGRLLLFEIIKRCFEKGLKNFDFMLGQEDYKRFWNPVPHKLFFVTVYPKTLSGHISYMLFNRLNLEFKKMMGKKW